MQGHRSSISALPENLIFDNGSTSSDGGMDNPVTWSSMQSSASNRLPQYRVSSSETNIQYLHHVEHEHEGLNGEWSLGETSSSVAQVQGDHNERKGEHSWNMHSRAALNLGEPQYDSSNILSFDDINVNTNGSQTANATSLPQISGPDSLPQDLNMCSEFEDHEDDECQVVERPSTHTSTGSSTEKGPSIGSSSRSFGVPSESGGYVIEESENRPGCSLDGRRISCKRKALDVHAGPSSGAGSSNCFQPAERSEWHAVPAAQIAAGNSSMSLQTENNVVILNDTEQSNPRLRLRVGGALSASPLSLPLRGTPESSRRNLRLRINGSEQQDHISGNPFSMEADVVNADVSSSRHSSRLLRNHLFDLNPSPALENGSLHGQSVPLPGPSMRRNTQSRWSGASSSRSGSSLASGVSGERDTANYEEPTSRNIPRSISEHPMFFPASEIGSSSQEPTNWNLAGPSSSTAGNVASASQAGSASGVNSSAPTRSNRSCPPQYSRRLSEIVRRSLLSSPGTESGGQSSGGLAIRSSSAAISREMALPSGSGNHSHRMSSARSALLERHMDGALGIPFSLRGLAAASEGRSSIMSEVYQYLVICDLHHL